jgi:hypothetical protein
MIPAARRQSGAMATDDSRAAAAAGAPSFQEVTRDADRG